MTAIYYALEHASNLNGTQQFSIAFLLLFGTILLGYAFLHYFIFYYFGLTPDEERIRRSLRQELEQEKTDQKKEIDDLKIMVHNLTSQIPSRGGEALDV